MIYNKLGPDNTFAGDYLAFYYIFLMPTLNFARKLQPCA
jgi:hypothetical protein